MGKAHMAWPSFKTTTSLPCPVTPLWKRVCSIMFSGRSTDADVLLLLWLTFSFSSWSRCLLRCKNRLFFFFCSPPCLSLTSHWWSCLKLSTFSLSPLKYVLHSRSDSLGNLRSGTVWMTVRQSWTGSFLMLMKLLHLETKRDFGQVFLKIL